MEELIGFKKRSEITDPRSEFANDICEFIFHKVNENFDDSIKLIKGIHEHFEINVRNIYELVFEEIPLFALLRIIEDGADNFDWSDEEYRVNVEIAKRACLDYYKQTD